MFASLFIFKNRLVLIISFIVLIIIAISLFKIGSPIAIAKANTPICGTLISNTTWTGAGSPYIVTCDVRVADGVSLTIQPNVVVKFDADNSLIIDGTLVAEDCTFTSNQPSPDLDDWGQLFFSTLSEDAVFDNADNYVSGSKIQNCVVEYAGNFVKGAIETEAASPFLIGNAIKNNGSSGIYATGRSNSQPILLTDNNLTSNQSDYQGDSQGQGGGVYVSNGVVNDNLIEGNLAGAKGGGIYATGSEIINNIVTLNETKSGNDKNGGGIFALDSRIAENTISGNVSYVSGGGIYVVNGTVIDNMISNNHITHVWDAYGGGIYAESSIVTNNGVEDNSAHSTGRTARGGGIYAIGGTLSDNSVNNNNASGSEESIGGGIYGRNNTLQQNIVTNNSANIGGGIFVFDGSVTNNTVENNTSHSAGGVYANNGTVTQNTIKTNAATFGGGIYAVNDSTLINNTVDGNVAQESGGGIYAIDSSLQANNVANNEAQLKGGGVYVEGGTHTNNIITDNTLPSWGQGSGAFLVGEFSFTLNDVQNNAAAGGVVGGVAIDGQPVQFQFNNIHGNLPYDAEMVSLAAVDGSMNYWGQSNCLAIANQIYDGDDMPGRGELSYAPSLYEPALMTELTMPQELQITYQDETTAVLSWNPIPPLPDVGCRPNDEAAIDVGYRLYYDSEHNCTFDGVDILQGTSPIDIGEQTEITLSDLNRQGTYYVAIAAYDYLGRKSPYSNLVVIPPGKEDNIKLFLPLIQQSHQASFLEIL